MKIALVSDAYFDMCSTTSSHIAAALKGFQKLGHEVRIFTSDINTKRTVVEDDFVAFPGVPSYSRAAQGVKVSSLLSISSYLDDFAPDIIHVFTFTMLSYMAVSYAIKNDIPVVCTAFDLNDVLPDKNNSSFTKEINHIRYSLLSKKIMQNCDKVLVFEKALFSELSEEYCEEEKLQEIALLSDTDIYSPKKIDALKVRDFKESYEIGFNKAAILFAGDLSNTLLVDSLLDTWSGCVTPSDKIQLVIAGDGMDRETLNELSKIHGISSQIIFLEDITNEQLPLCFASCDAFIMPTDKKAVYIEPIEAVSCGTPVIVHKDSPMANILDKTKNAFVYSNNNELRKLLSGFVTLDNQQKMQISKFVASTMKDSTCVKQAESILNVYTSLF